MTDRQALGRARSAFEHHAWTESYRLFEAADREALLDPQDLERLATAAYLIGRMPSARHIRRARIRHSSIEASVKGRSIRLLARIWTAAARRHRSRVRMVRQS
jgi:hypothetical protein